VMLAMSVIYFIYNLFVYVLEHGLRQFIVRYELNR